MAPAAARAELPNRPTTVTVDPTGGHGPVAAEGTAGYGDAGISAVADSTSSKKGGGGAGGSYAGNGYTYQLIQNNTVNVPTPAQYDAQGALIKPPQLPPQQACPPGQIGYYVYDPAGVPLGVVCVPAPSSGGPGPVSPVITLAQQASSLVPWPNLVVSANPTTGLSGLASWFWIGGGTVVVPPASATAGPLTVTVRATLVDAIWDFGDGTAPLDSGSSLGKAYPTPSDVAHIYQASSYNAAAGYTLTLSLRFSVSYSVNGGPSTPFGTATRTYSRSYPVFQAQPEGVSQ